MSELISGKEAAQAVLNGEAIGFESVDGRIVGLAVYLSINEILNERNVDGFELKFYAQPKNIKINNIEIPAPFEPKDGEKYYYISFEFEYGYSSWNEIGCHLGGAWRTESEIKQVVAALRSIFRGE